MDSFKDIINRWPSPSVLAKDLGLPAGHVIKWRSRNNIPSKHWAALMRVKTKRRVKLTLAEMAAIKERVC